MTENSTKLKARELVNKAAKDLNKVFAGCLVCGKSCYPFKSMGQSFMKIRCDYHQKKLAKIWFEDYQQYIDIFKGQT